MPLYEYECPKHGTFEKIQKFSDPPLTKCPTCGGPVERLLSAPAIQFKGTGWYITDYARKSDGKSGKGDSGEVPKSEGSKSEASKSEGSKSEGSKSESAKDSGASSGNKAASSTTSATKTGGGSKSS